MIRTIAALLILAATPSVAQGQTLTVYSSLPLSGASRASTKAVNDGARLALRQSGNANVRLVTLNDATKQAGNWVPERVAANARRAARDASAIAYLGEFNSGGSRIAIPITNEAGLPMISPSSTYNGLTTPGPGTTKGEPDKYYPAGQETFFRIVPNDHVQAAALTTAMRDKGCTKLAVRNDREVYGRGMAADVKATAKRLGLQLVSIKQANCMAYLGITANGAVRIFKNAPKKILLFGGDGVAESGFTAHLPKSVAKRTFVTVATLPPGNYGLSGNPDPYRAFGYEAMKLVLDGIAAGATTKAALVGWLHAVQNRQSILGTYGFDANGDTTLRSYGLYGVSGHSLRFAGVITAA